MSLGQWYFPSDMRSDRHLRTPYKPCACKHPIQYVQYALPRTYCCVRCARHPTHWSRSKPDHCVTRARSRTILHCRGCHAPINRLHDLQSISLPSLVDHAPHSLSLGTTPALSEYFGDHL